MKNKYKVFIIAGEPSGDVIGSKFMKEFILHRDVEFYGIGGEGMIEQGMNSIFPISDISLFGYVEIIPHIFKLLKRIKFTIKEIKKIQPDIVLTIDSPGFCFRVIRKIQSLRKNTKFIHYVAPTVWAFKKERAKQIAPLYDHLLALLPFEPEYFIEQGLDSTFVGHPLMNHPLGDAEKFKKDHKISENNVILCLSPGSRKTEVIKLLPVFIEVANKFISNNKGIYVVIPTFHNLKFIINKYVRNLKTQNVIISHDRKDRKNAIAASNIALAKCGTITNEFALNRIPIIAAYKINSITSFFIKRMLTIKHVSLINILAKKEIIPELLQENCTVDKIYNALNKLYNSKDQAQIQIEKSYQALQQLNNEEMISPSKKAVLKVLEILEKSHQ